ncbi:TPA: restriction endonuclease subunit S [Vibrio cholerae]|uniref:restriction endonuclease subunit S n=1 Tax=Vibrio cholerae TaxID=666 RepID=UPI0021CED8FC|nr:restriction endonuclease subunit S [Vibrio cholerae]EJL3952834.1 restriction endonuclease subunit S [Vibrio cholerae]MCU4190359.1 restriction endonuclease subunit S [Vibrio cholerae]HCZ9564789.1 restriction endonuclease subunit S [Vibrio cholerae]HCZ9567848.1 restriction endonuclease subunit S [Vibrio cholerae]HCZ9579210.1 restriction endonuclease subunit S [Vibrio cholerae]
MSAEKLITDHIDIWTSAIQAKSASGRGSSKKRELYGIKKLRELILELAVRGKLVPQDPSDEPASVLLERIAAEKAQLVKDGKLKKQKPLPNVEGDEFLFELPNGWDWTRLGNISEIAPKNPYFDDNELVSFVPMPLISTSYKGTHSFEERKWGEVKKGYTHFADGDIAIAKITPCFENSKAAVFSGLINGVGTGTTELHVARPIEGTSDPLFILLYLKSPMFLKVGETKMTGSAGQKRVPKDFFAGNPLPLPPLQEQHRIVAKVDELMALCDQLEQQTEASLDAHQVLVETLLATLTNSQDATELMANWARISEHFDTLFTTEQSIDQLKQTILQLAVMGKLVPQDPNDEPAAKLLERIAEEKAQLVKEKKIKKQKALPPIADDEKPFELPEGWEWCRLGSLINLISGQHLKPSEYSETPLENGNPYITGPAEFGPIYPSFSKYTTEKRALAESGDVLITCKGAGLGKLNKANQTLAISRQLMSMQSICINKDFLFAIVDSKYDYFQSKGVGIAIPGISREDVTDLVVALPPITEQSSIISKLKDVFIICDQLKQRLRDSQQTQLQLTDAIVERAV